MPNKVIQKKNAIHAVTLKLRGIASREKIIFPRKKPLKEKDSDWNDSSSEINSGGET